MDKKRSSKRYPPELKERAVRMVQDLRREDPGDQGSSTGSPASWGSAPSPSACGSGRPKSMLAARRGLSTEEREELKRLRKENRDLRRSNDILQSAATFFGAELDRRGKK